MSVRASNAGLAANAVVEIFDSLRSTRTNFDTVPERSLPDGYLDRGEFPSRHFERIDKLVTTDGRLGRDELKIAFTRLPAADSADISARAATVREALLATGKQARWAIAPFAVGAFAAAGGLLVGGTLGLALLGLGLAGAGAGMAIGFGAVLSNARTRRQFVGELDRILGR